MPMPSTQGILYIATGEKYIRAACKSAKTVIKYCPGMAMHLYADWQNYESFNFEGNTFPFSSVEKIHDPHRRSKVDYLPCTPFDLTLYLDTDTALNADIRDMYRILERFDIAMAHAFRRNDFNYLKPWRIALPQAFPQFNSGVFLYRKTPAVIYFLENWSRYFKEAGFKQDQVTLRELLWLSDLRIATLPPEYNVRFLKYHFLWSKTEAQTRIFHLRMFHDGPFWFIKSWLNKLGWAILSRIGINPVKLKKWMKK
jgi:hypothetical protein